MLFQDGVAIETRASSKASRSTGPLPRIGLRCVRLRFSSPLSFRFRFSLSLFLASGSLTGPYGTTFLFFRYPAFPSSPTSPSARLLSFPRWKTSSRNSIYDPSALTCGSTLNHLLLPDAPTAPLPLPLGPSQAPSSAVPSTLASLPPIAHSSSSAHHLPTNKLCPTPPTATRKKSATTLTSRRRTASTGPTTPTAPPDPPPRTRRGSVLP